MVIIGLHGLAELGTRSVHSRRVILRNGAIVLFVVSIEPSTVCVGVGKEDVLFGAVGILLNKGGTEFDRKDNGWSKLFLSMDEMKMPSFGTRMVESVHGLGKDQYMVTSSPSFPVFGGQSKGLFPRIIILMVEYLKNGRSKVRSRIV